MSTEELGRDEATAAALTTERLGRSLRHFPIGVTSESLALAWARQENGPEGATVLVDQELSPRQRKGAPWIPFQTRGLYFSVVLRPGIPPDAEGLLWLLGALGAAEGLAEATGVAVSLKWPDDLLMNGRKVGGFKVDAQLGPGQIVSAVLTYRFNVNVAEGDLPEDLRPIATSVLIETGRPMEREQVLDAVLKGIERRYDDPVGKILEDYRTRCETIGRNVRALLLPRGEVMGTATAVDDFGALIMDVGGKLTPINIEILKKLETL